MITLLTEILEIIDDEVEFRWLCAEDARKGFMSTKADEQAASEALKAVAVLQRRIHRAIEKSPY